MNAVRVGALSGLAVTVPVAIWMLGTAAADVEGLRLGTGGVRALFVATAVCASFVLPMCATRLAGPALVLATACLLLVPLPLIVLMWLIGGAMALALAAGFGVLALFSLVILLISKATARAMPGSFACALVLATVQIGGGVTAFALRDVWLGWLGL